MKHFYFLITTVEKEKGKWSRYIIFCTSIKTFPCSEWSWKMTFNFSYVLLWNPRSRERDYQAWNEHSKWQSMHSYCHKCCRYGRELLKFIYIDQLWTFRRHEPMCATERTEKDTSTIAMTLLVYNGSCVEQWMKEWSCVKLWQQMSLGNSSKIIKCLAYQWTLWTCFWWHIC